MQVGYRKIAWVIAAWLAACGPAMAQSHGRSGKLDSYLGSHGPSGEAQPVIVTVRAGANKADVLQRLQGQGAKIERVLRRGHSWSLGRTRCGWRGRWSSPR